MNHIAILGGGPTSLYLFKRLLEIPDADFSVTIIEKTGDLGCGMPYGHNGAADEHITNVSGNEIPELVTRLAEWIKKVPKDTLDKYRLEPERFNEYKVLPRLLFGMYLCDQYKELLHLAKSKGIETIVLYNTVITDIIDDPEAAHVQVITEKGKLTFDKVIVATGHYWPKRFEGKVPGWLDSPYPPEKIGLPANHPVAIRGASLTAIDAVRTLARHNGRFEKDKDGKLQFYAGADSPDFRIVLHTRNGMLPAVRFHLEDTHLGKDTVLSPEKIKANRDANDGFLSLDYVFEENFKEGIKSHDPDCYEEIRDMNMETFVGHMLKAREAKDPFELLRAEYAEAEKSIARHKSVYWKEQLAILSFAMNYPAKHFSAEDWLRLENTLMPLISVVIAFVPQSSAETLMALHEAGRLSMTVVDDDNNPKPDNENGGAHYGGVHYPLFVDCIGQPHLQFDAIPFEGLKKAGAPGSLRFRDSQHGQEAMARDGQRVQSSPDGHYYLTVPGMAINDRFQLLDAYNALNDRIYVVAVPFIGGFNPDYSGLDFGEAAAGKVAHSLFEQHA